MSSRSCHGFQSNCSRGDSSSALHLNVPSLVRADGGSSAWNSSPTLTHLERQKEGSCKMWTEQEILKERVSQHARMKTNCDEITFQRSGPSLGVHVHQDGSLSVFVTLRSASLATVLTLTHHHRLHPPLRLCDAEGTG